jgi:methionyl-tRNA synthetase
VEGTCYICGFENARGDQCDNCGNLLDSTELINPRSKTDGSAPQLRETEHFYLDLGKLEPEVVTFLEAREAHLRPNVLKQSLGQIRVNPLHGRAITRDLDWGIPVPIDDWEGKCLYVWFEAVIGYLSAAVEHAHLAGDRDAWQQWWYNPAMKSYYFIGKDNIPFHAVMWPAQLAGVGATFSRLFDEQDKPLTLPFDVPANEFMNMEDRKISGSANWGVWGLDFLSRYDPDPLRFYLTINMPESKDSNWDWDDFVARNNNLLVANWGNLANRVLSFAHKHWEGVVPTPGELAAEDTAILEIVQAGFDSVGSLIEAVKLRAALNETLRLSTEVNKYLDEHAPWSAVKTDKAAAGATIYVALQCIDHLKTLFAPFLPHTSEQLHAAFGYAQPLFGVQYTDEASDSLGSHAVLRYNPEGAGGRWSPGELTPGRAFAQPSPLFRKLEDDVADEERARLGR